MLCPIIKFNTCQMLWVWFMYMCVHLFSFRIFLFAVFLFVTSDCGQQHSYWSQRLAWLASLLRLGGHFYKPENLLFCLIWIRHSFWVQLLILHSFYVKKHSTRVGGWIAVKLAILKHGALWDSQRYWLWKFCCGQTG